jgi:predicted SAM-dependent methyltransferase
MNKLIKLHLGCGERYFDGYVNIDYPQDHQTIIKSKADKFCDILDLHYKPNSIDEIRLHHVFEHFDRPTAIALLCKWRTWLKPGGLLRIETPDAEACYKMMISPFLSFDAKQQVNRHLFGSHEASWAVHWDGWYKDKYKITLEKLGYNDLKFVKNKWGLLRNIEVFARKDNRSISDSKYSKISKEILVHSTVRVNQNNPNIPMGSEINTINTWMDKWRKVFAL